MKIYFSRKNRRTGVDNNNIFICGTPGSKKTLFYLDKDECNEENPLSIKEIHFHFPRNDSELNESEGGT